jgi:hypothetical protein
LHFGRPCLPKPNVAVPSPATRCARRDFQSGQRGSKQLKKSCHNYFQIKMTSESSQQLRASFNPQHRRNWSCLLVLLRDRDRQNRDATANAHICPTRAFLETKKTHEHLEVSLRPQRWVMNGYIACGGDESNLLAQRACRADNFIRGGAPCGRAARPHQSP